MEPQVSEAGQSELAALMLADFYRRSHRVIDRSMSEQGASFARARLLLQIMREGPLRSADLAAMFSYAPRTVTEAVDGLERDGLVRRDPDPLDRRAKRISLTPAGLAAAEGADRVRREHIERVFGTLTVAECEELTRLIEKLNDRLAELGGASDSRP